MNKRTLAAWQKQIKRRQEQVGKLRDSIRDEISEMESLADCCERAYDDMQNAMDALSELA
jgi:hypothetical protein